MQVDDNWRNTLIMLCGPTASGKTDLALALADRLRCELVSVDSALVYRGMNIGTAKPDSATLLRYPHHLVDIREPEDAFSAADFCREAHAAIAAIAARGRIPLLVGGTMLYFRALLEGLAAMPSADPELRERLQQRAQREGLASLHAELASIDPEAAARIHPNDPQRILRALEVWALTGASLSEHWHRAVQQPFPYRTLQIAVAPPQRSRLHELIEQRFDRMLELGFVGEVEHLRLRPELRVDAPSMRSVGYRQVWSYLDGQCTYAQMREQAIIATRQLAKRQYTWLRKWQNLYWLDGHSPDCHAQALKYLESAAIVEE